jgi:hypothetical protein
MVCCPLTHLFFCPLLHSCTQHCSSVFTTTMIWLLLVPQQKNLSNSTCAQPACCFYTEERHTETGQGYMRDFWFFLLYPICVSKIPTACAHGRMGRWGPRWCNTRLATLPGVTCVLTVHVHDNMNYTSHIYPNIYRKVTTHENKRTFICDLLYSIIQCGKTVLW